MEGVVGDGVDLTFGGASLQCSGWMWHRPADYKSSKLSEVIDGGIATD
jgi:hypothetical protein